MPRSRTSRHAFILLFGSKRVIADEGPLPEARCPRCGASGSMKGIRLRHWFTIFFLPLFPMGKGQRLTHCGRCGASFDMPSEQFTSAAAKADARQMQRAIAMYNSLRASPANSITLNELMLLYGSMGEYDQAASAAAEFPAAVNNSEQCMTTLGRVYLAMEQHNAALQWLDAALVRDPNLAEALYFKAVVHLRANPRDVQQALIAARAAKKLGHPGADEVLTEAESQSVGEPSQSDRASRFSG